jgi:hypothetical protein
MRFACLIAFGYLLVAGSAATQAQEKPKHPERSRPDFATIYRVNKDKGFIDCRFVRAEPAPGADLSKKIYKEHIRRDVVADVKAFDGEGNKLAEKDLWNRLKEGTLVLVFWNELDPLYLRIARKDAVVLVLPSVSRVIGISPR